VAERECRQDLKEAHASGGSEQDRVQHGEHPSICADSESQRNDYRKREQRIASQQSCAVTNILQQAFKPVPGAAVARVLPDTGRVAERPLCRGASLRRRHAARQILARLNLDVLANLLVVVPVAAAHQASSPCGAASTPATARTTRSQRLVSAASLARPLRVSL